MHSAVNRSPFVIGHDTDPDGYFGESVPFRHIERIAPILSALEVPSLAYADTP